MAPPQLDHIILLVPYATLLNLPAWITANFTVTLGGRHADGKTENKLVCFRDGSYIELIAFINDEPKHREGHWWGKKNFGIIDFAFTTDVGAEIHFAELERRLKNSDAVSKGLSYDRPVQGARKRHDGQEVKWNVTFPVVSGDYQRGELAFFCHDITPRSLRAPFTGASVVHPNSAYGIKQITIFVPQSRAPILAAAYSDVLDVENLAVEDGSPNIGLFEVKRVNGIKGASDIELCIRAPSEEQEMSKMEEDQGFLLGDMIVGAIAAGGDGNLTRIDAEGEGVGKVFLQQDLPSHV